LITTLAIAYDILTVQEKGFRAGATAALTVQLSGDHLCLPLVSTTYVPVKAAITQRCMGFLDCMAFLLQEKAVLTERVEHLTNSLNVSKMATARAKAEAESERLKSHQVTQVCLSWVLFMENITDLGCFVCTLVAQSLKHIYS